MLPSRPALVARLKPGTPPGSTAKAAPEARYLLRTKNFQAVQDAALLLVPELRLEEGKKGSLKEIAELARLIHEQNQTAPDGFLTKLCAERPDLAGLPFLRGKSCQLDSRARTQLSESARRVRGTLELTQPWARHPPSLDTRAHSLPPPNSALFWEKLELGAIQATGLPSARNSAIYLPEDRKLALLPALLQILAPEYAVFRRDLVAHYRTVKGAPMTQVLVRLALYDPNRDVRLDAVEALRYRQREEYGDELVQALRYPWPAVAYRAAEAAIELQRSDLVPKFVDFLGQPDPSAPFQKEIDGKGVWQVRELVRLNHHRNCLLCHAPAGAQPDRNDVLGVVPSLDRSLPDPASMAYYSARRGETVVRASVTYLRQDFSLLQSVADAEPWPELQRFDFLVRTRTLSAAEEQACKKETGTREHKPISEQHQAALLALRVLTGNNLGPDAAPWRRALAANGK
jgi:hypothetical protein